MADKLSASQALRQLDRLRAHLSSKDFERVQAILKLLDPSTRQANVAVIHAQLFPGAESAAANKALLRLRDNVNAEAEAAKLDLQVCITEARSVGAAQRAVWFEGDPIREIAHQTPELERVGDRLVEDSRGKPLFAEPCLELRKGKDGKPIVRWFLSYAHKDQRETKALLELLETGLKTSPKYHFEPWQDRMILIGADANESIRAALREAHLGVLMVSPSFFASDFIVREELPAFINGQGRGVEGKRIVPLGLKKIDFANTEMKGVARHQIFFDEGKAFVERSAHRRDAWVQHAIERLHELLDRYATIVEDDRNPGDPSRGLSDEPLDARAFALRRTKHLAVRSESMLSHDLKALGPSVVEDAQARPSAFSATALEAQPSEANGVDALDYVLEWVRDPQGPRLFALLGEYGMGKTITCQRVVRKLEELRGAGEVELPHPLYFDLRTVTGLRGRTQIPKLAEIIDECMRGWQHDGDTQALSATELIAQAGKQDLLFIFDGLDEALVHLTEVDGQAFTRELLSLRPPRRGRDEQASGTRVLISCRTHFFRTLQAQNTHFTAQDRDTTPASDYRALVLLPFGEEQVRTYLGNALPSIDLEKTLETVKAVHNLSELASRPFTLRLVAELIPNIERLRSAGRPVYGVTLYREMVQRWLHRDDGKHHIKSDHKQRLMTHLAAWMWKRGQRLIEARELEPWFHAWLDGQADLRLRYAGIDRDKLEEDLRTATFLVREDDKDGAVGGFRFAHSSMHEFFLALHLFEAVRADRREDWVLPEVSRETLAFFAELLMESSDAALLQRLGGWRAPYLKDASEQWLRYALSASARKWPALSLAGIDVRGANLHGWRFQGASSAAPLNLSRADFRGCELRETVWHDVRLDDALFDDAKLDHAEWIDVHAPRATLQRASCDGSRFRRCIWPGSKWSDAVGTRPTFMFSECPAPWARAGSSTQVVPRRESAVLPAAGRRLIHAGGHSAQVLSCAFSPDGTRVVSASVDCTLKLWDVASAQCIATWTGHENWVQACAFSPDGTRVISASFESALKLWDVASAQCIATWTGHEDWVQACAFSPDGTRAVSASADRTLKLWDVASAQCIATWTGHEGWVLACAFSPDGTRVVSASDDHTLKLWDVATAQCIATWTEHEGSVLACAFSPDGTRVVSASDDGTLKLWDAATAQCIETWRGHENWVHACAFSADGTRVVSASFDRTLKLWDVGSAQCIATWTGHGGWVQACAFSPDGTRVISASYDRTLKLWDVASAQCIATWTGHESWVQACAFSPDGTRVVSASDDSTLKLWDAASARCIAAWTGHGGRVLACAFSPDGRRIISASDDSTLKLWDVGSAQCIATWTGHEGWVQACAFSPDGTRVVSASDDSTLKLWDAASARCIATWTGHGGRVLACAFSPDGRRIISASYDRTLKLWDVETAQCIATWRGHVGSVPACAFSPDGTRVVSTSSDLTLKLWDVATAQCIATWTGHQSSVLACAFSPDGTRVVSASDDSTLKLWDVESAQCIATWTGHEGRVQACAFSPNGERIASTGADGAMLLRSAADGRILQRYQIAENAHATWDPNTSEIIEASEGAWRWLAWQIFDAQGRLIDVLPAEAFGPLPPPKRMRMTTSSNP